MARSHIVPGGMGIRRITLRSSALHGWDAGGNDTILRIGSYTLAGLTADEALGSVIDTSSSIAYNGGVLQVDLDGNGIFDAASDFQISLAGTGVTSVTYSAAGDFFILG